MGEEDRFDAPTVTTDVDGPAGPLQLLVVGPDSFRTVALPRDGTTVVGRGEDVDVHLDDGRVSRRHALFRVGPDLAVEDLGSANGTLLRGRRLDKHEAAPLLIGESVQVGSILLFVQRGDAVVLDPDVPAERGPWSKIMRDLHRTIDRVAVGHINVLVLGETGAGKDVLSRYLHDRSPRAMRPFVRVNCATLSETLLENELFGHEKGAFSGAGDMKPGLLETADGGTAFLDEVGELPLPIQSKLLAVIETKQMLRLGGVRPRQIDVRVVAATNRNLEAEVEAGRFRRDLYFRLNGFTAVVPPLRARVEEIVPLALLFTREASQELGLATSVGLSEQAAAMLCRYHWPGNVRELRNVVRRAVLLCEGGLLMPRDFTLSPPPPPVTIRVPVAPADGDTERQRILSVLAGCGGNQTKAARILKMARGTLASRLRAYGVPLPRTRDNG